MLHSVCIPESPRGIKLRFTEGDISPVRGTHSLSKFHRFRSPSKKKSKKKKKAKSRSRSPPEKVKQTSTVVRNARYNSPHQISAETITLAKNQIETRDATLTKTWETDFWEFPMDMDINRT